MGQVWIYLLLGVNLIYLLLFLLYLFVVIKGDYGFGNNVIGMKRGLSYGNFFMGLLDLVRQENYGLQEGVIGVQVVQGLNGVIVLVIFIC